MDIITLDFETYYSQEYSLSKITTEEYIRDPRFQIIGVGVKVNDGKTEWFSGTHGHIKQKLASYDWANSAVLAHNMMFDGAILSWRLDTKPKVLFDTLCMARAIHGVEKSASLKALAESYGVGQKGTEVLDAKGKRRADFTPEELHAYGNYCINDVDLTYDIFNIMMSRGFPKSELKLIDLTLRMFTEPALELDRERLEAHLKKTQTMKDDLLKSAGLEDKADLMSNPKFAALIGTLGAPCPMKISPTTGKLTYALAKSDQGMKDLLEHNDPQVQALAAARLGVKSTLEETRTQRFIDISGRGMLPVPVRYYAAHTGRWGGDDKINLQNLPSRGPNAKALKKCIITPEGYSIIESDSSQIEARMLAWLAGQHDVVHTFATKGDVYKKMASAIYGVDEADVTKDQRFVGKTTVLGAGYGMGGEKFQLALKNSGVDITKEEAVKIIGIYRETNNMISSLWKQANIMLRYLVRGDAMPFGKDGVLGVDTQGPGIILPNGLLIRYDELEEAENEKGGVEYSYKTRIGRTRIYGGKVVENVTQALARLIIGEQMLRISKRYRVVLTVHDSIVCCVPDEEAETCKAYVEECMRWAPAWAEGLPVDCDAGIGKNYGETE
jgi:DNA polymerase I-like protein with 3'-5' exonuclease and polymerase domains